MLKRLLKHFSVSLTAKHDDSEAMSRRSFLIGAGAVIGTAVVASGAGIGEVEAAALTSDPSTEPDEELIELAQLRRDDRGGRRRDDRGGRRRRDDRRFSRRDLARQCRRSKRFRRNNRRLCNRVTGRGFGRRGSCIQIGPLTVCE